jgi:hypothetical protein
MSLNSLTFGSENNMNSSEYSRGKVKVVKAEKFVGIDAVCVISRLVEGAVAKRMRVVGKNGSVVVSVECKSGDNLCTKIGMQVVLMIEGINKEDYPTGSEMLFEKCGEGTCKPKGRIIIA